MSQTIVVFKTRLAPAVEDRIQADLDKMFPEFELYVAHGLPGNPSFVGTQEEGISDLWRGKIFTAASEIRQRYAPSPRKLTRRAR